ncbi:DMT family transporter [Pseudodesulfovibrio sp.]|uniref:DMT family transporter n=1 Tax=Pseudodesulfovibrio sp. TaxID=2035812 RepID=UPI00261F279F|nr:DMT family transporter [Pseudodesulfovibrio sp.]MDD3312260.1 DMT family transporter [Pseudodesulfovibrio sp.]
MNERTKALLLMAATALIWSSGGLAIKLVPLGPMAITGARSALAALTLLCLFRGRLRFRLSPVQWAAAAGYAGLLVTNVAATKWTTSANAILLAYTAPVYGALLAPRLLGERTRPSDWAFIAATVGGMALFFLDRLTPAGLLGNILAVGTGLSYAAFTLSMRAQKDASPVESVILGHGLTALCGLPFLFGSLPDAAGWAGLLYLGALQQGVSLALYVWAIKRLGALEAILVMMLEPIFNPIWVALGYGELPGPFAVAGGVLVIGAVTLRGVRSALRARP